MRNSRIPVIESQDVLKASPFPGHPVSSVLAKTDPVTEPPGFKNNLIVINTPLEMG